MIDLFKPELTQKNHFKHGFADREKNNFSVYLGGYKNAPGSGLEESKKCARYIYDRRKNSRIALCLSGGIDSECMLDAFSGLDTDIYFLRFQNDLNDFDISTGLSICESRGLKFKVIDIDVIRFFESGLYLEYGRKYRCQSPQLATHMWLLDQIDGVPILAGNPFVRTVLNGGYFFIGLPGDLHCSLFRYFEQNKRFGVPWFFIYSPEQIAAFLNTPTAQMFAAQNGGPDLYTYAAKCNQYSEAGFAARPRENKYTGFEKVRAYYDAKLGTANGQGFDQLFRRPLEQMNPFPQKYLQFVPAQYFQSP